MVPLGDVEPTSMGQTGAQTSSTPDRSQNGTTKRGLFFWMEGSASRRVRRLRQFGAVRRRGRILLPGPSPASERRPIRP